MSERPLVVLSIDGLRASALGSYGNAWFGTPALDSLAAESTVYDWFFATSPELRVLMPRLWSGRHRWPSDLLLTDDAEVAELGAQRFATGELCETPPLAEPGRLVADSSLGRTFEFFAQALGAHVAKRGLPRLAWLHTRGMYGGWDAPLAAALALVDDDDPEPHTGVSPPDAVVDASDPDAPFRAACRYAGQVVALDACVDAMLEALDSVFADAPYTLALLGVRGFPLGEHGRVGGVDLRLYSPQHHTPLIVRRGEGGMSRCGDLVGSRGLGGVLAPAESPAAAALVSDSSLGRCGVRTHEWLLVAPAPDEPAAGAELYVKPDDRWDMNDIASLRPQEVAELLSAATRPAPDEP